MHFVQLLEDYKHYICQPQYIPYHQIPFYIIWVEKFLMSLEDPEDCDIEKKLEYHHVENFIHDLKRDPRYEIWQIQQAIFAIEVFIEMLCTIP